MRSKLALPLLVVVAACRGSTQVATAPEASPPSTVNEPTAQPDAATFLAKLPAALADASVAEVLANPPAGIRVQRNGAAWELAVPTLDVAPMLAQWGWTDAFAVSGDVHQRRFRIMRKTQELSADRIATRFPSVGRWQLEIVLDARPAGPLPGISAGASPAYPLPRYAARFSSITIELRDLEDVVDELATLTSPTMADVDRVLGPSDGEIGSGIYIERYVFDDETTIRVGSTDHQRVTFIVIEDAAGPRDLYRAK